MAFGESVARILPAVRSTTPRAFIFEDCGFRIYENGTIMDNDTLRKYKYNKVL